MVALFKKKKKVAEEIEVPSPPPEFKVKDGVVDGEQEKKKQPTEPKDIVPEVPMFRYYNEAQHIMVAQLEDIAKVLVDIRAEMFKLNENLNKALNEE